MRASAERLGFGIVPIVNVVSSDVHAWCPFSERNAENIFAEINPKVLADMSGLLVNAYVSDLSERY
jgi:hypothetical protein